VSQVRRLVAGFGLILSLLILSLIYIRAVLPLIELAPTDGPFSAPVQLIPTIMPVVIGGLLLATSAWIVFGPVQEEKSTAVERRRR